MSAATTTQEYVPTQFDTWMREHVPDGFWKDHAADIATMAGLVLDFAGAEIDGRVGMTMITAGELADKADGKLARGLDRSSKFGKFLDAITDKVKKARLAYYLLKHTTAMPESTGKTVRQGAVGVIATKQIINTGLNTIAQIRGNEPETPYIAKKLFFIDSVAMGCWGWSDVVKSDLAARTWSAAGYGVFAYGLYKTPEVLKYYADSAFGEIAPNLPIADSEVIISEGGGQLFGPE